MPATQEQVAKHLTDIDIAKILGLAKAELPQRDIASIMDCSQKAVRHTLTTYHFETFQGRNPRQEYKRKTTAHEDQYIERALNQNEWLPLQDITDIINKSRTSISKMTLCCRRSEVGLGSYIAAENQGCGRRMLSRD